jgi:hypothetical protein
MMCTILRIAARVAQRASDNLCRSLHVDGRYARGRWGQRPTAASIAPNYMDPATSHQGWDIKLAFSTAVETIRRKKGQVLNTVHYTRAHPQAQHILFTQRRCPSDCVPNTTVVKPSFFLRVSTYLLPLDSVDNVSNDTH